MMEEEEEEDGLLLRPSIIAPGAAAAARPRRPHWPRQMRMAYMALPAAMSPGFRPYAPARWVSRGEGPPAEQPGQCSALRVTPRQCIKGAVIAMAAERRRSWPLLSYSQAAASCGMHTRKEERRTGRWVGGRGLNGSSPIN